MSGLTTALMSAKSMTIPVCASTSPDTCTTRRYEWPWRRAHLWSVGTPGRRCAASNVNSLKSSTLDPRRRAPGDYVQLRQHCGARQAWATRNGLTQPPEAIAKAGHGHVVVQAD